MLPQHQGPPFDPRVNVAKATGSKTSRRSPATLTRGWQGVHDRVRGRILSVCSWGCRTCMLSPAWFTSSLLVFCRQARSHSGRAACRRHVRTQGKPRPHTKRVCRVRSKRAQSPVGAQSKRIPGVLEAHSAGNASTDPRKRAQAHSNHTETFNQL